MLAFLSPVHARELSDAEVTQFSRIIFFGPIARRDEALSALVERGKLDVAPTLILATRYRGQDPKILQALRQLTRQPFMDWKDAMLWQEARSDIVPHASFRDIKLQVFRIIDSGFERLLSNGPRLAIRLEEIVWGGAYVGGIPALNNPKMIASSDAGYLRGGDLVFGVEVNGDARAYPLRILGWHEMLNDVVGGVPVALTYCPLCGSGILYETQPGGHENPLIFGSSGLLYRSNKLMFDAASNSLWHQLTGKPVSGPMLGTGVELKKHPMVITRWENWKHRHPSTTVLSSTTGYTRDYGSGVVYRDYLASPDTMFPSRMSIGAKPESVAPKSFVFGLTTTGKAKAWPLNVFKGGRVLNDVFAGRPVVLIGDAASRTVRAYERRSYRFTLGAAADVIQGTGQTWRIKEAYLQSPTGEKLPRIPGRVTYWFAWNNHLNFESELFGQN